MNLRLRTALVITGVICLTVSFSGVIAQHSNQPGSAKIKRKSGDIVEGKIHGTLAQKTATEEIKEGKTLHSAEYLLTSGASITAIDEGGVQSQIPLAYFAAGGDESLDDTDVVNSAMRNFTGNDLVFGLTGKVGLFASGRGLGILFKEPGKIKEMSSWQLIGEVRKEDDKYRIIRAIEIETDKGVITIPIDEIASFKTQSAKPENAMTVQVTADPQQSKPVSNGTNELRVKKVIRGRNFGGVQTRSEGEIFLTVYIDTKDRCFDWHDDQKCFDPPLGGLDKLRKACGFVKDGSGKKYDADGGGKWEEGTFCNYIVPKTLGAVTLNLHDYPEIALPKE